MSWFGILVVFVIVWWLVFLITLPFGVTQPEEVEPGHAAGAPDKSRLALKASIATAIAVALTGAAVAAIEYEVIAFRAMIE
jgi:predicted secreted protein